MPAGGSGGSELPLWWKLLHVTCCCPVAPPTAPTLMSLKPCERENVGRNTKTSSYGQHTGLSIDTAHKQFLFCWCGTTNVACWGRPTEAGVVFLPFRDPISTAHLHSCDKHRRVTPTANAGLLWNATYDQTEEDTRTPRQSWSLPSVVLVGHSNISIMNLIIEARKCSPSLWWVYLV